MMWLVEYVHNDAPPDVRTRRQFNSFYLGVPDAALAWQIAARYIELIRQHYPNAALYAVRETDNPWKQAVAKSWVATLWLRITSHR